MSKILKTQGVRCSLVSYFSAIQGVRCSLISYFSAISLLNKSMYYNNIFMGRYKLGTKKWAWSAHLPYKVKGQRNFVQILHGQM